MLEQLKVWDINDSRQINANRMASRWIKIQLQLVIFCLIIKQHWVLVLWHFKFNNLQQMQNIQTFVYLEIANCFFLYKPRFHFFNVTMKSNLFKQLETVDHVKPEACGGKQVCLPTICPSTFLSSWMFARYLQSHHITSNCFNLLMMFLNYSLSILKL